MTPFVPQLADRSALIAQLAEPAADKFGIMTTLATHATTKPRPQGMSHRISLWAILLLGCIGAATCALLVADRYAPSHGTLEVQPVRFDAAALDPDVMHRFLLENGMTGSVRAVVVHFRDGNCPCTTLADARFLALMTRHAGADVVFATAEAPGAGGGRVRGLERLPRLSPEASARLWQALPAAPAVAVFDGEGRPRFLGPYAEGAHCSASHGGKVEATLAGIDGTSAVAGKAIEAAGCVCDARRGNALTPVIAKASITH